MQHENVHMRNYKNRSPMVKQYNPRKSLDSHQELHFPLSIANISHLPTLNPTRKGMKSRVAIILASECLRPEIVMLLLRSLHSSRSCQYSQLINCEKFKINSKFLAKHHAQNMKLLHLCKDHDHQFNLAVTSSFLPKHSQLISLKKTTQVLGHPLSPLW